MSTSLRNSTFSFKAARVKAETELSDVQDDVEIPLQDGHWTFVKKRHPVIKAPLEADTIPWDLLRPARKLDCTLQAAQKSLIEFKSSKLLEDGHHQDSAEANELLLISGTHRIHQTMKIKKRKSRRRIIERVMKYSRLSSQDWGRATTNIPRQNIQSIHSKEAISKLTSPPIIYNRPIELNLPWMMWVLSFWPRG